MQIVPRSERLQQLKKTLDSSDEMVLLGLLSCKLALNRGVPPNSLIHTRPVLESAPAAKIGEKMKFVEELAQILSIQEGRELQRSSILNTIPQ